MSSARAAAAITNPEQAQRMIQPIGVLVVALKLHHGTWNARTIVAVIQEVREHLGAVQPPPHECLVRKRIELVPGQLAGCEVVQPAFLHDLWERRTVAEHIRDPEVLHVHTELLLVEPLAM